MKFVVEQGEMGAYGALVRCFANFNMAVVAAAALGYVDAPAWLLHLFLWPAVVFSGAFACITLAELVRGRNGAAGGGHQ